MHLHKDLDEYLSEIYYISYVLYNKEKNEISKIFLPDGYIIYIFKLFLNIFLFSRFIKFILYKCLYLIYIYSFIILENYN